MPLDESGSKASVGKNIATEEAAGRPPAQAKAIALNVARKHGAKIPVKRGEKKPGVKR